MENAHEVLDLFLSMPLESSEGVMKVFEGLEGAVSHQDGRKRNFVYLPGRREDRVLLVAHADTVWDEFYIGKQSVAQRPVWQGGLIRGENPDCGLGADDRAGCAMLYLLRDSGHSLLVTDGEEEGQIGARYIGRAYPELFDELNRHRYMIQLDRRGPADYKFYDLNVTEAFRRFVEESTGYHDAGTSSRTDIVSLCRDICGVNLSVGYEDEHWNTETLNVAHWMHTLEVVTGMIAPPQPAFPLAGPAATSDGPWSAE